MYLWTLPDNTQAPAVNNIVTCSWLLSLMNKNSLSCLVWRQAKEHKLKCLEVSLAQNDHKNQNIKFSVSVSSPIGKPATFRHPIRHESPIIYASSHIMSPCPLYKRHRKQFGISQRSPLAARWRPSRSCYWQPQLAFCYLSVSMQQRRPV